MITKTYLFANKHPKAGLSFSGGEGINKIRGFWSGGETGRFILKQLILKYGQTEAINIYTKYNQALLEIKESGMMGSDERGNNRKVGSIVLYQNIPDTNDNPISLSEQGGEESYPELHSEK